MYEQRYDIIITLVVYTLFVRVELFIFYYPGRLLNQYSFTSI